MIEATTFTRLLSLTIWEKEAEDSYTQAMQKNNTLRKHETRASLSYGKKKMTHYAK
jgi:hypothetical protein